MSLAIRVATPQPAISARMLGELALPDVCERCFWVKFHQSQFPFQIPMPGIFSSIDSYTKAVVHGHFQRHGELPPWFPDLGPVRSLLPVPHWSKFCFTDPNTDLCLRGVPDDLLDVDDFSCCVVDYKTAKFTANQDRLYPLYAAQLNAYGYIGSKSGLLAVPSSLWLIYMEPVAYETHTAMLDVRFGSGFEMAFAAKALSVPIDIEGIEGLLGRAAEIVRRPIPPGGSAACQNCLLVEKFVRLVA